MIVVQKGGSKELLQKSIAIELSKKSNQDHFQYNLLSLC